MVSGGNTQTIAITTNFSQGAWLHFPVNVPAGGSLTVTVTKTGGPNAVLSGLFLGGAGPPLPPPPPPPPPYEVAPQGDWVGTYGSAGYVLAAWNGTAANNDLVSLPAGASAALEVGSRAVWATSSSDVRALDTPDKSQRRAGIYHAAASIRVRLSFANGYNGTLHLYAVDWDNLNRRETVCVVGGGDTQTIAITTNFSQGAWLHFPVNVPAGGALTVTVTKTGGPNAVLSGLFLGGAGPPLPPPPPPPPPYEVAPQGDWVGAFGSAGYVLAAWNGTAATNDLVSLPAGASAALEVGSRAVWATSSSDVRALDTPDKTQRRLGIYHSGSALRVRLSFATATTARSISMRSTGTTSTAVSRCPCQWRQHPDHRHHHQLQPGCLAALPGQCPGRRLADRDGHQDRRSQRRAVRPVP